MKTLLFWGTALAMAMAMAVPAQAIPFTIDNFVETTQGTMHPSYTGTTLSTSTAFNLGNGDHIIAGVFGDDTTGAVPPLTKFITPQAFTYSPPTSITASFTVPSFSGPTTYTETYTSITPETVNNGHGGINPNAIDLSLSGTVTDGTTTQAIVFLISATQVDGPGHAVSWSGTEFSQALTVPEIDAASGAAAIGVLLGAMALAGERRRRRVTQSVDVS